MLMFNILLSIESLFALSLGAFVIILTIRKLFIYKIKYKILYYGILFIILFIAAIGGGGVQNDGYRQLEEFEKLEQTNKLAYAKKNLHEYNSMLQSYLIEFESSKQFKEYLQSHDPAVDKAEAISIGFIFAILAEISTVMVWLLSLLFNKKK